MAIGPLAFLGSSMRRVLHVLIGVALPSERRPHVIHRAWYADPLRKLAV